MKKSNRKLVKYWPVLLLAAALAASALTYFLWPAAGQSTDNAAPTIQTARVLKQDLSVSISGTGSLSAGQTADLGFTSEGRLAVVTVQLGDTVKQGQVLAALDNTEQLRLQVQNDQLGVQTAQNNLDALTANTAGTTAQAQSDLAAAEKALSDAQQGLRRKGQPRCESATTQQYYFDLLYAQKEVNGWEQYLDDPKTGYGHDYLIRMLTPLWKKRDQAQANLTYCQGFTQQEIDASQAALLTAQTNLTTIQNRVATLQANNGIDPDELALAQAALNNAQAKLTQSQADLVNATLTAPFDGLVTTMNAKVGQLTGKSSIMTIAATTSPRVIASFDETDLSGLVLNCPAEVTFSSNQSKTYPGTVTQILPQMVNSSVKAAVSLGADAQKVTLGSSASVQVTCQQAKGALVITSQALHTASDGSYYVYVPGTAGQPVKRTVTVGIQTTALAQITDGLTAGEAVIVSGVNQ